MKLLQELRLCEDAHNWPTTKEEIIAIIENANPAARGYMYLSGNYEVHDDLTVTVDGDVEFASEKFTRTHLPFKFRHVTGSFSLHKAKNLETLEGLPFSIGNELQLVGLDKLRTLKHFPLRIGEDCLIERCDSLYSLKGMPEELGAELELAQLPSLASLEGCAKVLGTTFRVTKCPKLVSLKHMPRIIKGNFTMYLSASSLVGICDYVDEIGATVYMCPGEINKGGLGLVQLAKRLMYVLNSTGTEPIDIIKKYIGTDNIIECQSELIEAGYEEYAQL